MLTQSEIINELEELFKAAQEGPEDAFTTEEWCELIGKGVRAVRLRLKAAKRAGRLETIPVMREALDGAPYTTMAYRITPQT